MAVILSPIKKCAEVRTEKSLESQEMEYSGQELRQAFI